ncbi:AEL_collapsed_G0045760.mRNA.1.CDS.1 [Saccharomyces cerevisiae]|nr:AEL_HP2_G0042080.mRNA.1.CDS.1 [Saccharomyces cerevisiae]CAI6680775.1 AEL_HP2_G0042080.mRNA.1.CDS.1 [Saccharomyces cerevisiae]CAI6726639.1 AEL_HP1_G0044200.mRNA.1.CDS.1 [Saccharomyces cerevisiae]CAI6861944.1 AEL_collapsed_G0045760.mRNA.1.CDS.1 [Saccharomyces cerevisiae]
MVRNRFIRKMKKNLFKSNHLSYLKSKWKVKITGQIKMDFDNLLNLEEQYYREGFLEGQNENIKQSFLEGKQYGLQVGFQRFTLLGQMEGLCDVIESYGLHSPTLEKNIHTIRTLMKGLKMNNDDESVMEFERVLIKLKNKFRTILITLHRLVKDKRTPTVTFEVFEDVSRAIAGEIRGFVENEDIAKNKTKQNQAQSW